MGWLAIASVAGFAVAEAIRILVERTHVVLYGDQALLELGARRAAQFDQLVGPYSREGFHHPGPAVFYLLSPFVRLFEPAGPGLYFGAIVLSGAALAATVAFVWRRHGALAALFAAVAIDLYCLCLGVGTLREPWNPYLIVAPMVLFVVLWAAAVARTEGSTEAAVWTLVVGSYEIQTHIATGALIVVMSVIMLGRLAGPWWRDHRAGRRRRWGPARIVGLGALALVWLPPVVEAFRDRPNNLQQMWDFFTSPHSGAPLHQALQIAGDALTILPFGNHDYVLALDRGAGQLALGVVLLVAGMVAAVLLGRRRRQPVSVALAAAGGIGAVIGTISLVLTPGPVYIWFAVWMAFVPLSFLLAIGIALLDPGVGVGVGIAAPARAGAVAPAPRWAGRLCVAGALALAALTIQSDLRMGPISTTTGSGPWPGSNAATRAGKAQTVQGTAALSRAAENVLGPADRRVNIAIGSPSLWPYVAGMVLELDERGVQSTVSPSSWTLYFGNERAPGRRVSARFDLYALGDSTAQRAAPGSVIAEINGAVLTFQRTSD